MIRVSKRSSVKESEPSVQRAKELSERELDKVSGAGCAWYEKGVGTVYHGTYVHRD